jgi:guanylate kinase
MSINDSFVKKVGKLFIISAPSGVGKTTIVDSVLDNWNHSVMLSRVITYTSRNPRVGEIAGKDYHFISVLEFEQKIEQGFFLEWSNAYGHYYGSPRSIVDDLEKGHSYIGILDRSGGLAVKAQVSDSVLIWVYTSSIQIIEQRLYARNTEDEQQIQKRLLLAQQELAAENGEKKYHYHIANDSLEHAVGELTKIIQKELLIK